MGVVTVRVRAGLRRDRAMFRFTSYLFLVRLFVVIANRDGNEVTSKWRHNTITHAWLNRILLLCIKLNVLFQASTLPTSPVVSRLKRDNKLFAIKM